MSNIKHFFLRVSLIITLIGLPSMAAYSQLTLTMKNKTVLEIIKQIEKISDYRFFYSKDLHGLATQVSVEATNSSIETVLNQLTKPASLSYTIRDKKQIVLTASKTHSAPPVREKRKVTGTIVDNRGELVTGAAIAIKGTAVGTISDMDGNFIIDAQIGQVLEVSFIGYSSKEFTVGSESTYQVTLSENLQTLDEVVVVGYGLVKKSDLTGSLSQVKSKDINMYPSANVLQALTGKAAGVQVMQNTGAPGGSISVRIRGANSLKGSNEPLYVVDGFPVSSIAIINNSDIESMEVLKDASATAIYGSRGANGVVMITTRQGKVGKTQIDFEASYSSQSLRKKLDLMDATEYAKFYNMQRTNDGYGNYFKDEEVIKFGKGYDWQNLGFSTAPLFNSAITVSGGTKKTKFSTSFSLYDQQGIIKGSSYQRFSIRSNVKHEINSKLSAELLITLSKINQATKNSGGGNRGSSLISSLISAPPTLTPYNEDESYRVLGTAYPFISNNMTNSLNYLNETSSNTVDNRILSSASLVYKPIPELTIKVLGGIENSDSRSDSYNTTKFINSFGYAAVSSSQYVSYLNENTATYNKVWNKVHHFTALGGFTYQDFEAKTMNASGTGFVSDISGTNDLASAATPGVPASSYSKSVLLSYLGRLNYNFADRYLFTASFRADGSSKFSKNNKWGYFPSGAFAWRVLNEPFMKDVDIFSDLKLRLSWGVTGSQAIGSYATLNQLSSGKTVFSDALYTAYAPSTQLPGNLKWESTDQKSIGIDLGFLKNRITLTADYYEKYTKDLLNTVPLPPSYGYTSTIQNVGEVSNKGLEITLGTKPFVGDFTWDLNFNFSLNRNKVTKLYNGDDILGGYFDITAVTDYSNILREGYPIGQFWGYLEDGYTDKGAIKYKNMDDSENITVNDKTFIGDPNPDFIYAINSVMGYKDFEFSFFLQGSQGNDIFNIGSIGNTLDYGYGLNMLREVYLDNWTPDNPDAKYPLVSRSTALKASDRFIHDGSYLRLKNIQLAYTLRAERVRAKWFQSAQFYISGQNLLTFTGYNWWDPEINSKGGANSVDQGYDYYSYPTAKSVTFGVRMKF